MINQSNEVVSVDISDDFLENGRQSTACADAAAGLRTSTLLRRYHPVLRLPAGRWHFIVHRPATAGFVLFLHGTADAVASSDSVLVAGASQSRRQRTQQSGGRRSSAPYQRKQTSARVSSHSFRPRPSLRFLSQEGISPPASLLDP